jgi:hypothetical protein
MLENIVPNDSQNAERFAAAMQCLPPDTLQYNHDSYIVRALQSAFHAKYLDIFA